MALSAFVIFDVRTTGSDTANGGAFDPSVTAGMFTDGAATVATGNSPVFTSASYNFVIGDVGAWLFVASGTSWTPGWYEITSVASNAATLKAAVGEARPINNNAPFNPNTVAGCATVASPTGATWTIDYSQQDTARFSYTDLASAGAGLTVSSAATPFGKQMVGNMLVVASGTNFTAGNYIIASVSAGFVATVTGAANITTGAGASGVGGLGGAMATPGKAFSKRVAGSKVFLKSGTYTFANSTPNTAGGPLAFAAFGGVSDTNVGFLIGWDTERTVLNTGTRPVIHAGAITNITMVGSITASQFVYMANFDLNGNGNATLTGLVQTATSQKLWRIHVTGTTVFGIDVNGGAGCSGYYLTATGCSGTCAFRVSQFAAGMHLLFCEAYANTCNGYNLYASAFLYRCISSGNTGIGFACITAGYTAVNCVAYANTGGGYNTAGGTANSILWINCIAEANGAQGWVSTAVRQLSQMINCAGFNNTGGDYTAANIYNVIGFIAQSSGSFFTNAAAGDFTLNSTAGRGALLIATGYPQLLPRGLTTNFEDIGVSQNSASGSGGAVNPFNGLVVSR